MHNIKEIRNNLDLFKNSLKKRFLEIDVNQILELDKKNRKLIQEKENLEKAVAALKEANKENDAEIINKCINDLNSIFQSLSEKLYQESKASEKSKQTVKKEQSSK